MEKMKELKKQGKTMIFVSHSADSVKSLCDRAIWLYEGEIKMDGPSDKVLEEYLPKQLSKEEIKERGSKVIEETGATSMKDMGIVMKEAKAKIGAGADGKTINEVVKELLG